MIRRASRIITLLELKAAQNPERVLMDAYASLVQSLGPLDGPLTITLQLEDVAPSIAESRVASVFRATEA